MAQPPDSLIVDPVSQDHKLFGPGVCMRVAPKLLPRQANMFWADAGDDKSIQKHDKHGLLNFRDTDSFARTTFVSQIVGIGWH